MNPAHPALSVDPSELEFHAIRAQGPGGQNVNKVSSAIQLRFDIAASSLPEAVRALIGFGFAQAGFHRIFARLDAANKGSVGVMERLGLRREALFLQNDFSNGEWSDEAVYALLRTEWQAR